MIAPPGVGSELGGYLLRALIGVGGMGAVYSAEHIASGRAVAVKVMLSEHAKTSEFRHRFEREWRYAHSLDHPHIVTVHEVGEHEGVLWMAMDHAQGPDLGARIAADGVLEVSHAIEIVGQIASALDAVHATGLYHRDVKPANVISVASTAGTPPHGYLTDFGLSKRPSQDSVPLTALGFFVGTLDYTAPEQILGKELDGRVDQYSLGCVLYECLTGTPPFRREREQDVLYAHIQDPPPRVTESRPELPVAIDDVIARALAKKPAERFATCVEFVEAARVALPPARVAAPTPGPPPPLSLVLDPEARASGPASAGESIRLVVRDGRWRVGGGG